MNRIDDIEKEMFLAINNINAEKEKVIKELIDLGYSLNEIIIQEYPAGLAFLDMHEPFTMIKTYDGKQYRLFKSEINFVSEKIAKDD